MTKLFKPEFEEFKRLCEIMKNNAQPERGAILDEAKGTINGARQDQYGNPEDSFAGIAALWTLWLKMPITPHDVAMMMALLKVARIRTGSGSRDSYVDLCGYGALAADMADIREQK